MISMVLDRDCHKPASVLHNDWTQIVPEAKKPRVVLHSMELTNCNPAPTPSAAGSVRQKPDDDADLDTQECRFYRGFVGSLQYLSTDRCDVQFETKASWTRLKTIGSVLGRNPVSDSCTHGTWN